MALMNLKTLKTAPQPLMRYCGNGKLVLSNKMQRNHSVSMYWLLQDCGESYHLIWWCNGWVIKMQESYLCKDLQFKFKDDIKSFVFSNHGNANKWEHVYISREEAIKTFMKYYYKTYGDYDDVEELKAYKPSLSKTLR